MNRRLVAVRHRIINRAKAFYLLCAYLRLLRNFRLTDPPLFLHFCITKRGRKFCCCLCQLLYRLVYGHRLRSLNDPLAAGQICILPNKNHLACQPVLRQRTERLACQIVISAHHTDKVARRSRQPLLHGIKGKLRQPVFAVIGIDNIQIAST